MLSNIYKPLVFGFEISARQLKLVNHTQLAYEQGRIIKCLIHHPMKLRRCSLKTGTLLSCRAIT